jgi:hypothetical protein
MCQSKPIFFQNHYLQPITKKKHKEKESYSYRLLEALTQTYHFQEKSKENKTFQAQTPSSFLKDQDPGLATFSKPYIHHVG